MNELSDKTACVVDRGGLFTHVGVCLAESFKHVFYVGPAERTNPHLADEIVGHGFPNMQRVHDLWQVKNESDIFVFTDIGLAGEQKELRLQGRPVWGHFGADLLEADKGLFLQTLRELGMAVPPHTIIKGFTKLKRHLMDREDLYVKLSFWRGDWETFHWRNRALDELELDIRGIRLGPARERLVFYVFDKIDTKIEDGVDAWFIDGQWPKKILHAMERKDKSLLGAMQDFDLVAEEVRAVNETFGPVLAAYGYRGAFSTEIRVAEETYFNDPTIRFGSPPSQLQTVLIKNLAEVIYHGAHGDLVEPEAPEPVGAQVLITSEREKDEWLPFPMPEELEPYVKSAFAYRLDQVQIAPNPLENWAGWLVATGNTIEEVIDTLKERKEMLPDGFDADLTSLCDLLRELEEAKEHGIKLTEESIPEPETVL